ncbi:hypothetical protein GCM10011320_56730 [Neoroseomonas lacus]|uniref:Integrase catalytic domain-containing protein n=1 Tax=Neoroseomonas lacus TaxID=287609 RepID=A0A917L4D1_9PROT|nr:hypothetical protein GCM10011320_56730 [Neoroseomonas lacus]
MRPSRLSLPFQQWPEVDRRLWETRKAASPSLFGPDRLSRRFRPASPGKTRRDYCMWLGFLSRRGELDPTALPAARAGALQWLRSGFRAGAAPRHKRRAVPVSRIASISALAIGRISSRNLIAGWCAFLGPSYIVGELADWLAGNGIRHTRGVSCHPQTQGKIKRWHQILKNRIPLENHYLPGVLEAQVAAFVEHYNHRRAHESLQNLTPADVYFGRGTVILRERDRIKRQTIQRRRLLHQQQAA